MHGVFVDQENSGEFSVDQLGDSCWPFGAHSLATANLDIRLARPKTNSARFTYKKCNFITLTKPARAPLHD